MRKTLRSGCDGRTGDSVLTSLLYFFYFYVICKFTWSSVPTKIKRQLRILVNKVSLRIPVLSLEGPNREWTIYRCRERGVVIVKTRMSDSSGLRHDTVVDKVEGVRSTLL